MEIRYVTYLTILTSFSCTHYPVYISTIFFCQTSQPGPSAAREKFNGIKSPIWTFFVKQSFFSSNLFRCLSLGYHWVRGLGWRDGQVLRTPDLVWRSVQNLVEIGMAVRAWKRDFFVWDMPTQDAGLNYAVTDPQTMLTEKVWFGNCVKCAFELFRAATLTLKIKYRN